MPANNSEFLTYFSYKYSNSTVRTILFWKLLLVYWSWMNNSLSVKSVDHYFHMGYFLRYIPCQCSIFKLYYYDATQVCGYFIQDVLIFEYIAHVKVKLNSTRFKKMTLVNVVYRTSNVKIIRVCQCDKSAKGSHSSI